MAFDVGANVSFVRPADVSFSATPKCVTNVRALPLARTSGTLAPTYQPMLLLPSHRLPMPGPPAAWPIAATPGFPQTGWLKAVLWP